MCQGCYETGKPISGAARVKIALVVVSCGIFFLTLIWWLSAPEKYAPNFQGSAIERVMEDRDKAANAYKRETEIARAAEDFGVICKDMSECGMFLEKILKNPELKSAVLQAQFQDIPLIARSKFYVTQNSIGISVYAADAEIIKFLSGKSR